MTSNQYAPHLLLSSAGAPTGVLGGLENGHIWYDTSFGGVVKARVSGNTVSMHSSMRFSSIVSGSSYYMPGRVYNSAVALTAITRDTVFYLPFSVAVSCVLTNYKVYVTTGGASSNVLRAGLWVGTAGAPTVNLADWGTQVATTTGVKTWSPGTTLSPGMEYYIGVASQVGTTCTVVTGAYHQTEFFPFNSAAAPTTQADFSLTTEFGYYTETGQTGFFNVSAGTLVRAGSACPVGIIKLT